MQRTLYKTSQIYASRLASLEIWIVGLVVGASLISQRLLPVSLIVILYFWLVRWIAFGHLSLRTPVDISIVFILVLLPITIWVTTLPQSTYSQIYRLLSGIGLFYAIANWGIRKIRMRQLVAVFAGVGLLLALVGLFGVQWNIGKIPIIPKSIYEFLPTLIPDTIHKNVLAGYLVILLPIGVASLLFIWPKLSGIERVVYIISSFVMVVVLVLTQSRGAWIAFGATLGFLALLRWRWGWTILMAVIIIGFVGINSLGSSLAIDAVTSNDTAGGIEIRTEIWSRAIYMIQDFPFTGIGMGSFGEIGDKLYPFLLSSPIGSIPHAHNLFLQVAVDLGIPGLIAWLAILLIVISLAWKIYRLGTGLRNSRTSALGAGLLTSQVALIVHGLIDAVTWGMVRPAPIVWAIWGLAIAGWNVYGASRVEELS
jgi:putative inorganic carbon (HCO3(-)) transporter